MNCSKAVSSQILYFALHSMRRSSADSAKVTCFIINSKMVESKTARQGLFAVAYWLQNIDLVAGWLGILSQLIMAITRYLVSASGFL